MTAALRSLPPNGMAGGLRVFGELDGEFPLSIAPPTAPPFTLAT